MRDILDMHTHTLVSGHAYSTIRENVHAAAEKGLELLAITEHAPAMPGSCHDFYFLNLKMMDRDAYEIPLLLGTELNILDYNGSVDMKVPVLKQMDVVIASLHTPCICPGTRDENTNAYLKVMENPYVNIIGHPDDPRFPVDYEALVQGAKEHHVLLELNNNSLRSIGARKNARELDIEMLGLCKKYQASIIIGSDAHVDIDVGRHDFAISLLEEIDFPEELVVNRSAVELKSYLERHA